MTIIKQADEITTITAVNIEHITTPVIERYTIASEIRKRIPSTGSVIAAAFDTVKGGLDNFEDNFAQLSAIATRTAAAEHLKRASEAVSDAASKLDGSTAWKILQAHTEWLATHQAALAELASRPIDDADSAIAGKASTAYTSANTITTEIERFLDIITSDKTFTLGHRQDPAVLIINFPDTEVPIWRGGQLYDAPEHADNLTAMRDYQNADTTRDRIIIAARAGWAFIPVEDEDSLNTRLIRLSEGNQVLDIEREATYRITPEGGPEYRSGGTPTRVTSEQEQASRTWNVSANGKLTKKVKRTRRR